MSVLQKIFDLMNYWNLTTLILGFIVGVFIFFGYNRRKNTAQNILKDFDGEEHPKPHKIVGLKTFVKPSFRVINFGDNREKNVPFEDIWEAIYGYQQNKSPVLIIRAEAGMGKSRILQYLIYKSLIRKNFMLYWLSRLNLGDQEPDMIYDFFKKHDSLAALLSGLKEKIGEASKTHVKRRPIIFLDGFDEFKALRDNEADTLLAELHKEITEMNKDITKVIITSGPEALSKEVNNLLFWGKDEDGMDVQKPIEVVEIDYFDNKQIAKIFNRFIRYESDKKRTFSKRRKLTKRLKTYICQVGERENIFRNPFYARRAHILLDESKQEKSTVLTEESALNKIIDHSFQNALKKYDDMAVFEKLNIQELESELFAILDKISQRMMEFDKISISNDDFRDILESLNSKIRSAFLNPDNLTLPLITHKENGREFTHKLFYEYFVARNIQKVDYKHKLYILKQDRCNIGTFKILKFYAHLISTDDSSLLYTAKDILDSVESYGNKQCQNEFYSLFSLLQSKQITLRENPRLSVPEIIEILPLVNEIKYKEYTLKDAESLILDRELDLRSQKLTNLNDIDFFGAFDSLDLTGTIIKDLSKIHEYSRINELKISATLLPQLQEIEGIEIETITVELSNSEQLLSLLSLDNINHFEIVIKVNHDYKQSTIKLYKELKSLLLAGISIRVLNTLIEVDINEILLYIKSTYPGEEEMAMVSGRIDFLDDVYTVQLKSMLVNYDGMRYLKIILAEGYCRRGVTYHKLKDYVSVLTDTTKAIELDPNNAEYYNNRGDAYCSLKDYASALADYTKAIELNPNKAVYYNNRGSAYLMLIDSVSTFLDYIKAVKLDPNNAEYYHGHIFSYTKTNDFERALTDFIKAIELDPNNEEYYAGRYFMYLILRDYESALTDSSKALELDPNNEEYYRARGIIYGLLENYKCALADLTKAINLDPNIAESYYLRGTIYYTLEDYQNALADDTKAIELDSNNAEYYCSRGITYYKLEDFESDLADSTKAIMLDPNNAEYYYGRGGTYHKLKNYVNALSDRMKAIELNPNNAKYYYGRGVTYYELKDYESALADYLKAVELDPDNEEYNNSLRDIYQDMNKHEEALTDNTEATELVRKG